MENYVSNTNTSIPNEQKSTLWRRCRCVEAWKWRVVSIRMCTGNPRPRETAVSCADRQRPAALPLPAWEQREPEQPQQESPAHHHQVQWKSTLYLWNTSRTHFTFPTWNHFTSSTLSRFVWIDLSVAVFFYFFYFLAPTTRNTLTLSITGHVGQFEKQERTQNLWVTFSLPSISPELSTPSCSPLRQTISPALLLVMLSDPNCTLSHPTPFSSPGRLVHSGPGKSSPLLDSDLSFGLRTGTKQGVETHVFRVDSAKDLSTWTHLLVEGCHNAAELIKEVTTGAETLQMTQFLFPPTIQTLPQWAEVVIYLRELHAELTL